MLFTIFDAESDGLLEEATRIHCLCASIYDEEGNLIKTVALTAYDAMKDFILNAECIIGHNIIRYDIPLFKKILGIDIPSSTTIVDTLGLSWYLYPQRDKHGLESWGTSLGVPKPVVKDWVNLSVLEYIYRCSEDVKINSKLFFVFLSYLKAIYEVESFNDLQVIPYLMFKLDCAREQEEHPLFIDREHCFKIKEKLEKELDERASSLLSVMPKVVKYTLKKKPKNMYKKDNSLSVAGEKWMNLIFDNNLDPDFEGPIKVIKEEKDPNPYSIPQLKAWLFDLGWQPTIFDHKLDSENRPKAVPQLQDKDKNLCPNIVVLSEKYPELENLEGFFMLQHRLGVINGFLEKSNEQGWMKAEIDGFTNTLRFKHRKPVANLPSVERPYGKEIRGAIMAPSEDYLFCGSDMSSLEDTTKQHYMYFYDPTYVMEMRVPGFDPHIDIALLANLIQQEDEEFFKWFKKMDKESNGNYSFTEEELSKNKFINKKRKLGKIVNFSGIYGAGPPKISLTTGMSLEEAKLLHTTYWNRNKAVKEISRDAVTKKVAGQMWLFNPVSKFWYSLRAEKDKFSTLNQGTGVYCFDTWVSRVRKRGIKVNLQYHDEIGFMFLKNDIDKVKSILTKAIEETNDILKLNVPLGISIDIGINYAEAH